MRKTPEQHEPEETRQADQSRPETHRIEGREAVVKKTETPSEMKACSEEL